MKAIGFQLVEVTNPNTGETSKKLRVKFDNCSAINLLLPEGKTLDVAMTEIKANREDYLRKVQVFEGEFGKYCRFANATIEDEF